METNKELIKQLSQTLFWDVEIESIDYEKNAPYIIDRVLSMGTLEDFRIIKTHYGKPKIKRIAKKLRYMNERVLHFCSVYFDTPISDFRCYNIKQSNQTHWNY